MDISQIGGQYVEIFDLAWRIAPDVFGCSPAEATPKVQKKIRKWVEKVYIKGSTYPPEVMAFVKKGISDGDFMAFLKACHDRTEEIAAENRRLFDAAAAELDEDVREALRSLWELQLFVGLEARGLEAHGGEARLTIEFSEAYDRVLILTDPEGLPEGPFDRLSFEENAFRRDEGGYTLCGTAVDWEEDTEEPFTIRFTGARVEITAYRADLQVFFSTPWKHLSELADGILEKSTLTGAPLNEKEKALLPLAAELSSLTWWRRVPPEYDTAGLPLLTERIRQHGFTELLPLIQKLDSKDKDRPVGKLAARLDRQKYEPLWRELYSLISDSQAEYPAKAEVFTSGDMLTKTRQEIQRLMEAQGYSGTYPDFEKRGTFKGLRLARSYEMDYIVGPEKNVRHRIHCTESCVSDELTMEFLCGTELLRKNEQPGDIFSCTFDAKGRRLFQTVRFHGEDLEQRVGIAVKRAELKRLTKEERQALHGYTGGFWFLFLTFLILGGGLFALIFTPGMMLVCGIITVIFAGFSELPGVLTAVPWLELFGMAWVLAGGALGLTTALLGRK